MKKKVKRVLCADCKKPIHIDDFGGADKKGLYHRICIVTKLLLKRIGR